MDHLQAPVLNLWPIPREQAASVFAQAGMVDPLGIETPATAAWAGQCFELRFPHGWAVISVGAKGDLLWCYGLAGRGLGMSRAADAVLCRIARLSGIRRIGFQTVRRGLVRTARAMGYQCSGPVGSGVRMVKELTW